ncbi:hypothetical protein CBS101457_000998 [Exobasidium rhododendri]|nr:hypothetical protein CBS101457_000998 [Exobasidium rhododendri]
MGSSSSSDRAGSTAASSMSSSLNNSIHGASIGGGKSSMSSTLTSQSCSSIQSSKVGEPASLQSAMEEKDSYFVKDTRRAEGNSPGSPGSPLGSDEEERRSMSRRISKVSHDGDYRQMQGGDDKKVLHQDTLAASPKPMSSNANPADVPMNMHDATDNLSTEEGASHLNASKSTEDGHQVGGGVGKRRYPCSHASCDKTFSTSGHAARHNRIHTGSKPYRCTFPGCNASFSRQDNSLQHYRTHVLHPKGRGAGNDSLSLEGTSFNESRGKRNSAIDSHLQAFDPETEATVRLGRKALEEGTAIAVVHEVVDGKGKKGEAVQRMVGQSKGTRRVSSSIAKAEMASQSIANERADGEDEDRKRDIEKSRHYHSSQGFPLHRSSLNYDEIPAYPSTSSQSSEMDGTAYSHQRSNFPPFNTAYTVNATYRPYGHNHHNNPAAWHQSASQGNYSTALHHGPYDKDRRRSSPYSSHPPLPHHDMLNRTTSANASQFLTSASHQENQASRLNSVASMVDHKRSRSLNHDQALQSRMDWRAERDQMRRGRGGDMVDVADDDNDNEDGEMSKSTAPTYVSASSPKKTSPFRYRDTERTKLALLPSPTTSLASYRSRLSSFPSAALTSQSSTLQRLHFNPGLHDPHLPLPSTLTTLPYSSDRSTSNLTPTTPLDDLIMQHGIRSSVQTPFSNKSDSNRTLAPIRSGQYKAS